MGDVPPGVWRCRKKGRFTRVTFRYVALRNEKLGPKVSSYRADSGERKKVSAAGVNGDGAVSVAPLVGREAAASCPPPAVAPSRPTRPHVPLFSNPAQVPPSSLCKNLSYNLNHTNELTAGCLRTAWRAAAYPLACAPQLPAGPRERRSGIAVASIPRAPEQHCLQLGRLPRRCLGVLYGRPPQAKQRDGVRLRLPGDRQLHRL